MPFMPFFISLMISIVDRIFPSASYTDTPSFFKAAAASSVGFCKARRIFLKWVPPSDPLIPLSANAPRTVLSSVVPPLTFLAVAPIVSIASPSCSTDVFDLLAV